jgi:hypothetical protein|tara:strand:+ start:1116 stop:2429 length:1314 start_codon:yes stop_codon:yes gene_type:complete
MLKFRTFVTEGKASPEQIEVKNYTNAILSPLGVKVSGGAKAGTTWHIRAAVGTDPNAFFAQFPEVSIKDSSESVSGTYDTYELTIKNIGTALFVNQTRAGGAGAEASLTTKQLTPDAFMLGGQEVTPSEIKKIVKTSVTRMSKLSDGTKAFLVDLLDKANQKGNTIDISDILPSNEVSKRDLATISKDFGEILAGIWACRNIGFRKIYFPSAINEPLADFFGIKGRLRYPISVKSGGGSSTTVKNLTDVLEEHMKDPEYIKGFTTTEKALLDVLFTLKDSSVMEGIVEANKILVTPGIKALAKAIGVRIDALNLNTIGNWLQSFKANAQIKSELANFHDTMNKQVDKGSWTKLKGKGIIGFVIGPMGHHLTEVLTKKYNTELTTMVRQITLVQLNIDVKKNTLVAKREKFKNLKFKFSWGGGAPNPNRNKIGFKVGK